jgi:DNA polymerase III alpha subunit (gram-positive type)
MIDLIAFLDVETSGLLRKDLPFDDPSQPRMLQISCKVVSKDREISQFTRLIKPQGWSIEAGAEAVHGIDEGTAYQGGVEAWFALSELRVALQNVTRVVGHNIQNFDRQIITAEIARAKGGGEWWSAQFKNIYDTMEHATPILNIPGQWGEAKWPTLEESVQFFGRHISHDYYKWNTWKSDHTAQGDVEATEFVYWQILKWERQHA